jgi:SAM-dependent MidA family methyltransferase
MDRTISELPPPDAAAKALSETLAERMRAEIGARGGWLGFDRYMEMALYEPGLGYYSAGSVKLGEAGDFVTAPELTPLFGRALAAELIVLLRGLERPSVLELGAGTGRLAEQILTALSEQGMGEVSYRILEPSADLAARQRQALGPFGGRVEWLDTLPAEPFQGAIVANEVADALPVERFVRREREVRPLGVSVEDRRFVWREGPEQPELSAAVERLEDELDRRLEAGFESEICLMLAPWLASLADVLARGGVLIVDYGMTRREYYHPDRRSGTLMCHYRHRAHGDPFLLPGLQDITAWVDFSACADAAAAARLNVAGFTTQGHFLLERAAADFDPATWASASLREVNAFKRLVLPGEMGERFKVLLLTRGVAHPGLPGRDLRERL